MNAYILRLWSLKYNTADIARMTKLAEAEVYRIIAAEQDRRRAEARAA